MNKIIKLYLLILFSQIPIFPQGEEIKKQNYREIFDSVESGIDQGIVEKYSAYFGKQVYLNIRGGESGYYSANQVFYILKNFFNARKPLGFSFTTFGMADNVPFATGRAAFRNKGVREYMQVYVSLIQIDNTWVIDKVNFF